MPRLARSLAAVAALAAVGCGIVPKLRAGAAVSGVISASATVDTENPILVDGFVRLDSGFVQIEASYGQMTYTYDYQKASAEQTGELDVKPLALTARLALGRPRARGVRKLWLLGGGVVFSQVDSGEIGGLDMDDFDSYRVVLGHEWDAGRLLVLVEAIYEASRDIIAEDPGWAEAVEINLSGYLARLAVGVRF